MRLLKLDEHGEPEIAGQFRGDSIPPYAILSHTWYADEDEVTLEDLQSGVGAVKAGFEKVRFCGQQAEKDGLSYFWVDSCCIDKRNAVELSEAINSMFRWYQRADKCYAYLSDVSDRKRNSDGHPHGAWEGAFQAAKIHTRGWTLQELLAPKVVEFFTREGRLLGDKGTLEMLIQKATTIPIEALRGAPLAHFPVNERLRWAAKRQTTRVEDKAYCLLGIFDVFLSPIYGEGDYALFRLKEEVGKHGNLLDYSLIQSSTSDSKGSETAKISSNVEGIALQERRKEMMTALLFDQMDARRSTIRDAQRKTCDWLWQHPLYVAWESNDVSQTQQDILWINGKPGAGKSTLIKYALARAKKQKLHNEIIVSFFFNARGDELEHVTEGMYRALLHQLFTEAPDLQAILDEVDTYSIRSNSADPWTLGTLQSLLSAAVSKLSGRRLKCYIDALDECNEQEIRDMVDLFEDLVDTVPADGSQLSICFASRHYPTIQIHNSKRLILEDEQGHGDDLTKYIRRHLQTGDGKLIREIRDQVQEKANGVFLWAVLVVDILNKEFVRGRIFAVKKRLEEIPPALSDLFNDILKRDCVNLDDLLLCLQWILFARRPLTREEFYFAMATGLASTGSASQYEPDPWNPSDVTLEDMGRFVLNSSKGLAELTKSKPPRVQFIHESVRDFLLKDHGLREIWPGQTRDLPSLAHEKLKQCCYNYLNADLTVLVIFRSNLPKASSDTGKELRQSVTGRFPFLEYASQNLLYHADEAAEHVSQHEFLAALDFKKWLHVGNLVAPHDTKRHSPNVSLSYIFAENNLARLMRSIGCHGNGPYNPEERYRYPIIAAFAHGHLEALKAMISPKDNVLLERVTKDPGFGERSLHPRKTHHPLSWVIRNRNMGLAELLVCSTPIQDLDSMAVDGRNPLELAIGYEWTYTLEKLLQFGIPKGTPQHMPMGDLLIYASRHAKNNMVELLLEKGADIQYRSMQGSTPLVAAVDAAHTSTVKLLLAKGAYINAADARGSVALVQALLGQHYDVAKILLDAGADVEIRYGDFASTPLMLLARDRRFEAEHLMFLLDHGADVNAVDKHGWTALFYAAVSLRIRQVNSLLAREALKDLVDSEGCTALFYVTRLAGRTRETDLLEIMRLLAINNTDYLYSSNGTGDVSITDLYPLHQAAACGKYSELKSLIDKGHDVNAVDDRGFTALFHAVMSYRGTTTSDQLRTVKGLLHHGADRHTMPTQEGPLQGRTLLQIIAGRADINPDVAWLLLAGHSNQIGLSRDTILSKGMEQSLSDYQTQLMLLEEHKKRLLMARQDQDRTVRSEALAFERSAQEASGK